ncbi:MAG: hypothetical protein IJ770_04805 [Alphaproteobacteria bacterium]|nr:hypothetical protein [Alphaproteobacteria bacterium]
MTKIKSCYMDKETLCAIGAELWKLRTEKRMYLRTVAYRTNLPARVIEGMEIGKFIQHTALRRLTEFYGRKMRIVFDENLT